MIPQIIGTVIGALAGYLYYRFVGCSGGACPLWSHPVSSSLFGAAMGFFLSGNFTH